LSRVADRVRHNRHNRHDRDHGHDDEEPVVSSGKGKKSGKGKRD
jgi:hypothetical protein